MARTINSAQFMMVVVAAATLLQSKASTLYHVGDSNGWKVPSGLTFSNWAAQHTFVVGDVLEFDFTTGQHTAAKVSQDDYNNCNIANPIAIQTNGPANYTLSSVGESYFICTMSNHCSLGQKLAVNVTSSAGSPSSSPPGSSKTSPPPPPPPPPNSATRTASAAAFALGFLSIPVAFFF